MSSTFSTEVEDVLDVLPIDPNQVRSGTGRITLESIQSWIEEGDSILTNLLKMNGASVSGDDVSIVTGRAAVKHYAAANALRKINSNKSTEHMQIWQSAYQVFAQRPREIAGSVPLETQVRSNVDPENTSVRKFGKRGFEW